MKRVKQYVALLLALFMCLSLLPAGALADGEAPQEPVAEAAVDSRSSFPWTDAANDELLTGYAARALGLTGGEDAPWQDGITALTGTDAAIYNALRGFIAEVAAGERASTVFEVTLEQLGLAGVSWTAAELGVAAVVVDDAITDEAVDAAYAKTDHDLHAITNTLLATCPYELYWYDKTAGVAESGLGVSASGSGGEYTIRLTGSLKFSFSVAEGYAAGEYLASTAAGTAVQTAVARARDIVSNYASASDYEKLLGYKNEICALVSYNDAAAGGGVAYGDPWQLVWVFDGDSGTNVVCEGYAKAFQYLCELTSFSNIVCSSVTGVMTGGTGAGGHMWNIVRMPDGVNYLVDVTNCDDGTVGADDLLFLAGYASGSVDDGYTYDCSGSAIHYAYDADARALFTEEELTMSALAYDPNAAAPSPIVITQQPQDVHVKVGDTAFSFSVEATGGALQYEWQYSEDGGSSWTPNGSVSAVCEWEGVVSDSMNGQLYRCRVYDPVSGQEVYSDAAVLSIDFDPITVTRQPQDTEVASGQGSFMFTVAATGGSSLRYEWEYSRDGGASWTGQGVQFDGTYEWHDIVDETMNGWQFRCRVFDEALGMEEYSDAATLTVKAAPVPSPTPTLTPATSTTPAPTPTTPATPAPTATTPATPVPTPTTTATPVPTPTTTATPVPTPTTTATPVPTPTTPATPAPTPTTPATPAPTPTTTATPGKPAQTTPAQPTATPKAPQTGPVGWDKYNGQWRYYDKNSVMLTGWQQIGGKWYYLGGDGVMQTGWLQLGKTWYYLRGDGVMVTGWRQVGKTWYYFKGDGSMVTGWKQLGGKWYYFAGSGAMATGWKQIGGKWYWFSSSGAMVTGWKQISGKWYYMNKSGAMVTGWVSSSGQWYYMGKSGAMLTNSWVKSSGKWYYMDSDGVMVTSRTMTIKGVSYSFDADGVMQ